MTNFGEPADASAAIGGILPDTYLAASFQTGNQAYLLEGAAALIRNPGTIPLNIELSLWTDVANKPSALLYAFPDNSTLPVTPVNTRVESAASGVVLEKNTAYWLAVRGTAGDALTWAATTSTNASSPSGWSIPNTGYYRSFDSGATWGEGSSTNTPILEIQATAVPEPGGFLLTIAGLALGALIVRKRR